MLTCKNTTRLISEGLDRDLSLWMRMLLRLHITMCKGCSAYRRQVKAINQIIADNFQHSGSIELSKDLQLTEEALHRIKKAIENTSP